MVVLNSKKLQFKGYLNEKLEREARKREEGLWCVGECSNKSLVFR